MVGWGRTPSPRETGKKAACRDQKLRGRVGRDLSESGGKSGNGRQGGKEGGGGTLPVRGTTKERAAASKVRNGIQPGSERVLKKKTKFVGVKSLERDVPTSI